MPIPPCLPRKKGLSAATPYFYIFLAAGMFLSKLSTQKMIDQGRHKILVVMSLMILIVTMGSYYFLNSTPSPAYGWVLLGIGYGLLQPLFQSFVTGTTPAPKRGTYLLSYDIGIESALCSWAYYRESIGLSTGFAMTSVAYLIGGLIYLVYVEPYYTRQSSSGSLSYGLYGASSHGIISLPTFHTCIKSEGKNLIP